jgi:SOS-response transcriptional repressor LexA
MNLDILEFNSRNKTSKFHTENNSSSYARQMEWNERLFKEMQRLGWGATDLARAMGHIDDVESFSNKISKYLPKPGRKPVKQPRGTMMADMALALGVSKIYLSEGADPPEPNATIGGTVREPRNRIQILGMAAGGDDGRFLLNGETAGYADMPASLEAVRTAYAVYVHGESMLPRYEPGEVVFVNPNRPVRPGDYVVAQIQDGPNAEISAYVKKFISKSSKELVLEQLNPPKEQDKLMRFPARHVKAVHRILRSGE